MLGEIRYGFYASEFVPPEIFNAFGALHSWWFINERIVLINAELKKDFNAPVTINNWRAGGDRKYSGFRPKDCTVGADNSQHRLANASDTLIKGYTADEVREHILKNKQRYMALGLSRLEDAKYAPTWCHLDCAWTGLDEILIVKPQV